MYAINKVIVDKPVNSLYNKCMGKFKKEKKVNRMDFTKKIKKPFIVLDWVKWLAAYPMMKRRKFKYEYTNIESLPHPCLILSNHGSFFDFLMMFSAIRPYNPNQVVAIDAFHDYTEFLMRNIGSIPKRKFVTDIQLLKNMKYCIDKLKRSVLMYPEARYSLDGTTSFLPDSLGKLAKFLKVPVVVINLKGNYVGSPQWNRKMKVSPCEATLTQIIDKDEVISLHPDEMQRRIEESFVYDDFKWQKENNIVIPDADRATGIHKILYQCPHCKTEYSTDSFGTRLWCTHCKKEWELTELGEIKAIDGNDIFTHVPDWFKWQRENVKEEVRNGTYKIEDDVLVHTLPRTRYIKQGIGKFTQTPEGTSIKCYAYGKYVELNYAPLELESVHIEYNYKKNKYGDSIDISTLDDSFWLHPLTYKNVLTKISIATEEIYKLAKENLAKQR